MDPPLHRVCRENGASIITEVVEEAGQGSGQGGDHDHGEMPPVKGSEKRLMRGCCGEEMIGDRVEGYPR